MHPALSDFIREVPELAPFLRKLDCQADDGNPHAASLRGAIIWVEEHAEYYERDSVEEKLLALTKLCGPPHGFVNTGPIAVYVGWEAPRAVQ